MISAPTLRSFDVFDTLLLRRYARPDHLHWMVGRRLKALGMISIDERSWRELRIAAENQCRAENPNHTLACVYTKIVAMAVFNDAGASAALLTELDEEAQSIRPNVKMRESITELEAKRAECLVLSDTYFSRSQICSFLNGSGINVSPERVFSSSETKKSKSSSLLYSHVLKLADRQRVELHHVGDNLRADVLNARKKGACATWHRDSQLNGYEVAMRAAALETCEVSLIVGAARAARLARASAHDSVVWDTGACVAGPILTAFVLWVVLEAKDRNLKRLYFLARDGQILCTLAQKLCKWLGLPIDCRYLLASRQALYLPSLGQDLVAALELVFKDLVVKPASSLLKELEIPDVMAQDILDQSALSPNSLITAGTLEAERLRAMLMRNPIANYLTELLLRRSQDFIEYFSSQGFFDSDAKGIVDLGWHGNLQFRIHNATRDQINRRFHGFYYGLHCCPTQISDAVSTFSTMKMLNQNLLETFCLAQHSSIHHYCKNDLGIATGDGFSEPDETALSWGVVSQQRGIEAFCTNLIEGLDPSLVAPHGLLSALKTCGLASLEVFTFCPSRLEAETYGRVSHAQGQTHNDVRELAPKMSSFGLLGTLATSRCRRKETLWTWGTIARSSHSIVALLIRCAIWIRIGRFQAVIGPMTWLYLRLALLEADRAFRRNILRSPVGGGHQSSRA